jgi:hypothetical protein
MHQYDRAGSVVARISTDNLSVLRVAWSRSSMPRAWPTSSHKRPRLSILMFLPTTVIATGLGDRIRLVLSNIVDSHGWPRCLDLRIVAPMALQSAICWNGQASRPRGNFNDAYGRTGGAGAMVAGDTWTCSRGTRTVLHWTSSAARIGSWRAWAASSHPALHCTVLISHTLNVCSASGAGGAHDMPNSVLPPYFLNLFGERPH